MYREAQDASLRFASEERCTVDWSRIWSIEPIPFHPDLIRLCQESVEEIAGTLVSLPSGPLHDAAEVCRAGIPTVMMFVQSLRGISHNKIEDTSEDHLRLAVTAFDRLAAKTLALDGAPTERIIAEYVVVLSAVKSPPFIVFVLFSNQSTRRTAMHEGIETLVSNYSVDETVARLQSLLQEKGIKLFCLIDHSGEAAAAGLTMRPTKLLIFGNPKAGTPLMVSAPSTALDLPLKILVAETESGKTILFWNDPAWLEQRHGFPDDFAAHICRRRGTRHGRCWLKRYPFASPARRTRSTIGPQ